LVYRVLQDFLSTFSARYWQYWIGFALIMMVLFGRGYGGIIAALIIGATIWFDLPPTTSFLLMGASLLVLGVIREPLAKVIAVREQQVLDLFRRIWSPLKIRGKQGHGAGA
jgi:hypothetical protein